MSFTDDSWYINTETTVSYRHCINLSLFGCVFQILISYRFYLQGKVTAYDGQTDITDINTSEAKCILFVFMYICK